MGFSGGTQSSSQSSSPWEGQQPYLRDIFSESQRLYQGAGPQYYDGNTVAPFSDLTQAGLGAQAARGAQGSASEASLNQYIQGTLARPGVDPTAIMMGGAAQAAAGGQGAGILMDAANPGSYFNQGGAAALDPSRYTGFRQTVGDGPANAQAGLAASINANPFEMAAYGAGGGAAPAGATGALTAAMTADPNAAAAYGGGGGSGPGFANDALVAATSGVGLDGAADFASGGPNASADTLSAIQNSAVNRDGTSISDVPRQTLEATAQGNFLEANPFLERQYEAATDRIKEDFSDVVTPAINAAFSKAGRTGSALQAQAIGDAADDLTANLAQTYAGIYGDNYQQERARQVDAAGQLGSFDLTGSGIDIDAGRLGLDAAGIGLGDDLARRGLAADLYGSDADRAVTAGATALSDDLSRRGLNTDIYQGDASRALDAAGTQMSDDLARRGLNSSLYVSDADRRMQASLGALGDDLSRSGLAFDSYFGQQGNELDYFNNAANRAAGAGSDLFSGLNSGVSNLTNLYGTDAAARQGAAGLTEMASGLDYQNIEALLSSGQITDEQAQRLINAERERFDYYQNLPEMRLLQYANIVNQNPFSQSSGGSSGMNVGLEF